MSAIRKFSIGDLVQLRSGSVTMTVTHLDLRESSAEYIYVSYGCNSTINNGCFAEAALVLVKAIEPTPPAPAPVEDEAPEASN